MSYKKDLHSQKKNIINILAIIAISIAVILPNCSSGNKIPKILRPKGALPSGNVNSSMKKYLNTFAKYTSLKGNTEFILHQAGSYQEYAKNINCSNLKYMEGDDRIKDIYILMDKSFKNPAEGGYGADAIEIDAQMKPGDKTNVYVLHDKIKKNISPQAKKYLENNSLLKVIEHFIAEKYHEKNKKIYIELKIPRRKKRKAKHSPLNEEERGYVKAVLGNIEKAINLKPGVKGDQIRRQVSFVSFNYYALEEMRRLNKESKKYKYYFIAASNQFIKRYIITWFDIELNVFNKKLQKKIRDTKWLTGIWFDPRAVKNISRVFNDVINAGRRGKKLEIFISTYGLKLTKYENIMKKYTRKSKLKNVKGLIFDVQVYDDAGVQNSCL